MDKDELRTLLTKKVNEFIAATDTEEIEDDMDAHEQFIEWLEEWPATE